MQVREYRPKGKVEAVQWEDGFTYGYTNFSLVRLFVERYGGTIFQQGRTLFVNKYIVVHEGQWLVYGNGSFAVFSDEWFKETWEL